MENLNFEQTRASRGQFVIVEYACTEDGVYRRTTDRSDGEITVYFVDADEIPGYFDEPPSHWAHVGISDELPWERVAD